MTPAEYMVLRDEEPDLKLPHFVDLPFGFQLKAIRMNRDALIAGRVRSKIINGEWPDRRMPIREWSAIMAVNHFSFGTAFWYEA